MMHKEVFKEVYLSKTSQLPVVALYF